MEITYRVVGVVDDQTHVIDVDLYNDNPPVLSESGSQTLVINDGMSANEVQDTGYSFGATDSDIGDVVTITVDDDRFYIADDGRLQLKASQNFTKAEAVAGKVQLKITATDDGAPDTLTDSRTVDITITPPSSHPMQLCMTEPATPRVMCWETVRQAARSIISRSTMTMTATWRMPTSSKTSTVLTATRSTCRTVTSQAVQRSITRRPTP